MNNLQHLYEHNRDFHSFITNHLVVFEHWYAKELEGANVDDDLAADSWLMGPSNGSDYNDGRLPEPCLQLDFGGGEWKSIELGNGAGYVQLSNTEWIGREELRYKMDCLVSNLSNGKISKSLADNAVIESVISEEYEASFEEERGRLLNDLETVKLYAHKVRGLLVRAYSMALLFLEMERSDQNVDMRDLEKMNQIYKEMADLGIEV